MFVPLFPLDSETRLAQTAQKEKRVNIMAHLQAIDCEGYTIRQQKTTVKGHDYTRHVVDYGTDANGKRVRHTFTSEAVLTTG